MEADAYQVRRFTSACEDSPHEPINDFLHAIAEEIGTGVPATGHVPYVATPGLSRTLVQARVPALR